MQASAGIDVGKPTSMVLASWAWELPVPDTPLVYTVGRLCKRMDASLPAHVHVRVRMENWREIIAHHNNFLSKATIETG